MSPAGHVTSGNPEDLSSVSRVSTAPQSVLRVGPLRGAAVLAIERLSTVVADEIRPGVIDVERVQRQCSRVVLAFARYGLMPDCEAVKVAICIRVRLDGCKVRFVGDELLEANKVTFVLSLDVRSSLYKRRVKLKDEHWRSM